jgi:hypothetical protein
MKYILKVLILLFIITISFTVSSINCLAWDDCPFGIEDEPYPGTCWRYVDENNDGICDRSQSEPTEEAKGENTQSNNSLQKQERTTKFPIMLIISFVIIILLIIILKVLVRKNIITNAKEKIVLNILLLIFFIPSAITGIILLLMSNMDILRELGQNSTQIHNITSLFFMWISGYHIIWHTKYYVKGIRNLVTTK